MLSVQRERLLARRTNDGFPQKAGMFQAKAAGLHFIPNPCKLPRHVTSFTTTREIRLLGRGHRGLSQKPRLRNRTTMRDHDSVVWELHPPH
jgi:hypothetical protein